ncbi:oxygenase MpaB family protein [Saccharopolyspora phatthalungensis]|uniref:oxygenase MpaB family protein n=1 Tax=Saccharopolyspora phatthalungensis TaxID=664693 RepID=UPI0035E40ED8
MHCAEIASFAGVVRHAGFPLTDAQLDRYFDEQRRIAALVGLDPAEVPGTSREMAEYFKQVRPELRRTADSELVYRFLHQPFASWWLLPANGYLPLCHLAYSALPAWARKLHGRPAFPAPVVATGLYGLRAAGLAAPGKVLPLSGRHLQRAVDPPGREGPAVDQSPRPPVARRVERLGSKGTFLSCLARGECEDGNFPVTTPRQRASATLA